MRKNRRKIDREFEAVYIYMPDRPDIASVIAPWMRRQYYNLSADDLAEDRIVKDYDALKRLIGRSVKQII